MQGTLVFTVLLGTGIARVQYRCDQATNLRLIQCIGSNSKPHYSLLPGAQASFRLSASAASFARTLINIASRLNCAVDGPEDAEEPEAIVEGKPSWSSTNLCSVMAFGKALPSPGCLSASSLLSCCFLPDICARHAIQLSTPLAAQSN